MMTSDLRNSTDVPLDFATLPAEAIGLEPDQIDQAVQLSTLISSEAQQWQTYLNALAVFGFEQWLSQRAAELPINREHCSVFQPQYANVIQAVCNLRVSEFNLCLATIGSLVDEAVELPRAVVDLPEFSAHFYVVLEILEEQEQAKVWGFLRHDQLIMLRQSVNLQAERDWTYPLPSAWFDRNSDHLLLYLRCLEPTAISLPEAPTDRLATLAAMQAELMALLPRLQSPDHQLWQVLSWEQGAAVLTSPELLDWLYQLQTRDTLSLSHRLADVLQLLTQPAVNVGRWLQDELDQIAQSLSWVLLPSLPTAATPLRSPGEEIDLILTQLGRTGMAIPSHARGGYKDLSLAEISLRLFIVTWPHLSGENVPEWTLLLILGAQSGHNLPHGTRLCISDLTSVLLERVLEQTDDTYLYARVAGTWNEKFLVTLALDSGPALTLPPFTFQPN